MKRLIYLTAAFGLMVAVSGCSSKSCGDSGFSAFKNRPFRSRLRSCFGGDACDTCCPPAGQPANCGTNVAPLCDSCTAPPNSTGALPLYSEPNLNGPITTDVIQNPSPIYPNNGMPGGVGNGVQPPNF